MTLPIGDYLKPSDNSSDLEPAAVRKRSPESGRADYTESTLKKAHRDEPDLREFDSYQKAIEEKFTGQGIVRERTSTYSGEFVRGVQHGRGTVTTSKWSYHGDFRNGHWEGVGVLKVSNSYQYEGGFKRGRLHGKGVETNGNGESYVGDFKNGKYHGQGTLKTHERHYVGQFKNGQSHGNGVETLSNGDRYVGRFKNGSYHGKGTVTLPDGGILTGMFIDHQAHGNFILDFEGLCYHCTFVQGVMTHQPIQIKSGQT